MEHLIPDAHDPTTAASPECDHRGSVAALRSIYEPISRRFQTRESAGLCCAFAGAWFKSSPTATWAPKALYLGPEVAQRRSDLART